MKISNWTSYISEIPNIPVDPVLGSFDVPDALTGCGFLRSTAGGIRELTSASESSSSSESWMILLPPILTMHLSDVTPTLEMQVGHVFLL